MCDTLKNQVKVWTHCIANQHKISSDVDLVIF